METRGELGLAQAQLFSREPDLTRQDHSPKLFLGLLSSLRRNGPRVSQNIPPPVPAAGDMFQCAVVLPKLSSRLKPSRWSPRLGGQDVGCRAGLALRGAA